MRGVFAVLGSAAIEGPVISWVADHRKHHAFADQPGDPHSPHVDHGSGLRGAIRGLVHAHVGWLFLHTHRGLRSRYAPDLIADPVVSKVDKLFVPCVAGGLIVPFLLGWAFGGTLRDGFTGMLWGGAVRVLVLHHATYSINSLCHFFGSRRFDDQGRVAQPALARPAHLRRGVAQQPPRLPDLGRPRAAPLGVRPVRDRDQRAREGRPRVGRDPDSAGAPGDQVR